MFKRKISPTRKSFHQGLLPPFLPSGFLPSRGGFSSPLLPSFSSLGGGGLRPLGSSSADSSSAGSSSITGSPSTGSVVASPNKGASLLRPNQFPVKVRSSGTSSSSTSFCLHSQALKLKNHPSSQVAISGHSGRVFLSLSLP